ncbi:MAG: cation transporter [Alphaproteobacteria bacterium]|nr:cation transporter [Alphaproteobacteria bacterium]MCB9985818.1 cation transporter [Micavibrio sp.]HPQ50690.1 cation diffusion facilitator family transporter [Alphaproteobacteria bacterium]HRK97548.1 cation diffusion facilitator family transporter [Alphaproteobacteria bacterium]
MRETLKSKFEENPALSSSTVTVATVIVLVFAKAVAVAYSDSAAVLSSLIDSLSDIGLSLMTLIAIKWSLKPADEDHRFGHGKIEGIAALLQAAFLIGGGSFLLLESFGRFLNPVPMHNHLFTLFLMGLAIALSGLIAAVQKIGAKKSGSLALEADSLHYSSDIAINGAVFLVVLIDYLGWAAHWLDPLCALAVAGIMARAALQIAEKSFAMLMDKELPDDMRSRMIAIIRSHPEVLGLHDMRTTQSGTKYMISFDIELDPSMLLWSAHEISREIEKAILAEFENAEIMIHFDPYGDTEDSRHQNKKEYAL